MGYSDGSSVPAPELPTKQFNASLPLVKYRQKKKEVTLKNLFDEQSEEEKEIAK